MITTKYVHSGYTLTKVYGFGLSYFLHNWYIIWKNQICAQLASSRNEISKYGLALLLSIIDSEKLNTNSLINYSERVAYTTTGAQTIL